jgi:lactate permease
VSYAVAAAPFASGAAALLAGGAANALGAAYAVAAPVFGALGGGLTGSNVGSNALFMPLQVEAAASTGSSVALIAGIQNVAGSHASYLSPQRLVLAATATGLVGREGEVAKAAASAGDRRASAARSGRDRRAVGRSVARLVQANLAAKPS